MDSLNLFDLSDRELLIFIDQEADETGFATTSDVATAIGVTGKHPNAPVGIRLGWMVKFGYIDKHPEKPSTWKLTRTGRLLMNGDLAAGDLEHLQGLDPAQVVTVTRVLTNRYRRLGQGASNMMRREWQRGVAPRR